MTVFPSPAPLLILVLALFISICFCQQETTFIDETSESAFVSENGDSEIQLAKFLKGKMESYGEWLRKNDPSPLPPTPQILFLSSYWQYGKLTCLVRNQRLSGHSKVESDDIISSAVWNLTGHYLSAEREVHTPYQFQGELHCYGVIEAFKSLKDVMEDIKFFVFGKWRITANESNEAVQLFNVGIREGGELDLTHSWINYSLFPLLGIIEVDGSSSWYDNHGHQEIPKHTTKVLDAFKGMYLEYLRRPTLQQSKVTNPSKHLFYTYLFDNVIKNVSLSEILSGVSPPFYLATPSTTPATTTSTPTTKAKPSPAGNGKSSSASWTIISGTCVHVYLTIVTIAFFLFTSQTFQINH